MKKGIVVFAGIAVVIFATALNCFAALTVQKTFTLSATVPAVTSISIDAYNVDTATGDATLESGTSLGFDPLTLDPVNNIYTADHYFYVNVQAVGGTPTTTLTFTQGANPNSVVGGNGLGWKGALTYTKVVGAAVTEIAAHPKELFTNVTGDVVLPSEITGGFFRAYLGLNTGTAMPTGGEIFNPTDKSGLYDGTLLVSATIP